jgi:hypothetical protein
VLDMNDEIAGAMCLVYDGARRHQGGA